MQDLWRDFLHDFVLQVVRRPVVAAGNSIGGFMSASLAADYPGVCQGACWVERCTALLRCSALRWAALHGVVLRPLLLFWPACQLLRRACCFPCDGYPSARAPVHVKA
jgi:hypothetical protein